MRNTVVTQPALKKSKLTPLPVGFTFPVHLTPLLLVQNWFIGDSTSQVIPYRQILACHFLHGDVKVEKQQKSLHQKMGRFMEVMK